MSQIDNINLNNKALTIHWADGSQSSCHYLWLRDNCPSGFHEKTQERTINLLSASPDLKALSATLSPDEETLVLEWSEGNHQSQFNIN